MPQSDETEALLREIQNTNLFLFSRKRRVVQKKPLFLYHVPKTAGITCRMVINMAQEFERSISPETAMEGESGTVIDWDSDVPPEHFSKRYAFISAWKPFGFHTNFQQDFNLFTVVREPFARVVSRFRYRSNLGLEEKSEDNFAEFFRAAPQQNHQTKMLAGAGDFSVTDDALLETAKRNLGEFFAVAAIENVNVLLENILSCYDLANVIGMRINVSPPSTTFDWEPYRDEVLSLNRLDQELHAHVKENQKLRSPEEGGDFALAQDDQPIHKYVGFIREAGEEREFKSMGYSTKKLEDDFRGEGQRKRYIEDWLADDN